MLIGNQERFGMTIVPVAPSWELRYGPESVAWAALSIWVAGQNVCEHRRHGEGQVRDAFYVPLGPVADWFVRSLPALTFEERSHSFPLRPRLHESLREWGERLPPSGLELDQWLDEREDFWSRHFLSAGAEGARLPNLAFLRQDDAVIISWAPPDFEGPPAVTMLHPSGLARIRWQDLQETAVAFVEEVRGWFVGAARMDVYPWLRSRAKQAGSASLDSALSLFCARSLAEIADLFEVRPGDVRQTLGLDPGSDDPAASPLCQVVRDLPPRPSPGLGAEILEVVRAARETDPVARNAWRAGQATARDAASAAETAEEEGYQAARAVRAELGCNGEPISDLQRLFDHFGVALTFGTTHSVGERLVVAGLDKGRAAARVLKTPRTGTDWGRRFEEARALGHLLLNPLRGGSVGAASSDYAQEWRRRRSGAFAAELLLPSDALEQASGGVLDGICADRRFENLLERYGVGARTAAHQLYNQRWLSSESVREELLEQYASPSARRGPV